MTDVPKDLTKLSDKELAALWDKTSKAALEARDDNKRVAAEVADRQTRAAAQEAYDRLSDGERDALAQVVQAVGIESKESVHNG